MIAERYIMREIIRPAVATCALLVFMFGSFIATRYWADAAQGELPGTTVMLLVLLRIAISLEVLIPTTLYLSVVIAVNRLHRDSEITAMAACGIGAGRVMKSVFVLSAAVAVLVACFSLYIRPWAWNQFFYLKSEAKANFDLSRMKGGIFYELWHGKRVIFAAEVDSGKGLARGIFIHTRRNSSVQVISAGKARQFIDGKTGMPVLTLFDGNQYEYFPLENREFMVQFERSSMFIEPRDVAREQRVKATPTMALIASPDPEERAEFQWRLVTPVSTVLLALVGVPLSRSGYRRRKSAAAPAAILVFAVYYNLAAMIKKWVAQGVVPWVPGIWWSQIFLLILLAILMNYSRRSSS